jgi:hypothetical protein
LHGAGLYSLGAAEEEAGAAEDEDEDDEVDDGRADAPAPPEPPLPLLLLLLLLPLPLPAAVCGPKDAMSWSILAQTKSPTPVRHLASEPLVMWRG